jgi:septal ring factor EnvC (AmiA/AmiB activator)
VGGIRVRYPRKPRGRRGTHAVFPAPALQLSEAQTQRRIPMRTIILGVAAALVFGGAACKSESEKRGSELKKAQERVEEQREDIREEQKDVTKEQRDVSKEQQELSESEAKLAAERSQFQSTVKQKLASVDAKIASLDSKTDAKSKERAAELRMRRNEIAAKLDRAGDQTAARWNEFTTDIGEGLDKLEKDVDKALD